MRACACFRKTLKGELVATQTSNNETDKSPPQPVEQVVCSATSFRLVSTATTSSQTPKTFSPPAFLFFDMRSKVRPTLAAKLQDFHQATDTIQSAMLSPFSGLALLMYRSSFS